MSEPNVALSARGFRFYRTLWSALAAGLAALRNLTAFGRDMRGLAGEHPGSALLIASLDVGIVFAVMFCVAMPLANRIDINRRWAALGYFVAAMASFFAALGIGFMLRYLWANAMVGP